MYFFFLYLYIQVFFLFYIFYNLCFLLNPLKNNPGAAIEFKPVNIEVNFKCKAFAQSHVRIVVICAILIKF